MDRYFESNGALVPPTAPTSTDGAYPTDGDLINGVPASTPGAWWFHMFSEEIRNVIVAAGITPSFAATNQLLQAIRALGLNEQQVRVLIEEYSNQSISLTGSSNAFVGALNPAITSNSSLGEAVVVNFPSAITGAATLNLGGGATALVDAQGNAFSSANTVPAGNSIVQYDPTISKYRVLGIGGIDQVARNAAAAAVIPPGVVHEYEGIVAPAGYLMCDGSAVSRTNYSALFAVIGTKHGAGDGSTTFNVPDRRDRMPIGAGTIAAVGDKGGSKDAVVVAHSHNASSSVSDPGHSHPASNTANSQSGSGAFTVGSDGHEGSPPYTDAATTGISVSTTVSSSGVDGTNKNLPPYIGTNFIIKT